MGCKQHLNYFIWYLRYPINNQYMLTSKSLVSFLGGVWFFWLLLMDATVLTSYTDILMPEIAESQNSVWLDDAFDRARQLYVSYFRSIPKSLERATAHKLMTAMLNGDERFIEPTPQSLQNLTLKSVKDAVMNQFVGGNMEVCDYLLVNPAYHIGKQIFHHLKGACLHSSGKYCWRFLRGGGSVLHY